MATLHNKYPFFLFFFSESIARLQKKHHNKAKATGMRLILKVHLICVGKENQYV